MDLMTESDTGAGPPPENNPTRAGGHALRDQEGLWREVLSMAADVEAAFKRGVEALCGGRLDLVASIRANEPAIDRWEVRIEAECLRVLALYGLVASDLRRVVSALRINRDLEGLADIAENLAKRAPKVVNDPSAAPFLPRLKRLADESVAVVDAGFAALKGVDAPLARRVIEADHAVDAHRSALLGELKDAVRSDPEQTKTWLRLISSARNLERAADHATNIAEAVVYMKEGIILRRGDHDDRDD